MGYKGKKTGKKLLTGSKTHSLIQSSLNKKTSKNIEELLRIKFG